MAGEGGLGDVGELGALVELLENGNSVVSGSIMSQRSKQSRGESKIGCVTDT